MSGKRRGDKTFTKGIPTTVLRAKDRMAIWGAGSADRVTPPSRASLRRSIAAHLCPWCGSGPFQNLGCHTNRIHGWSAGEIRDLAGMLKGTPICSPKFSEIRRATMAGRPLPASAYDGRALLTKRVYSEAGRLTQKEKFGAYSGGGWSSVSDDQRRAAARAGGDKQLRRNAETHKKILAAYESGVPVLKIAKEAGVPAMTVRRVTKRAGMWVDGRTRRFDPAWRP